jgi:hypothetical protein
MEMGSQHEKDQQEKDHINQGRDPQSWFFFFGFSKSHMGFKNISASISDSHKPIKGVQDLLFGFAVAVHKID